MTNGMQAVLAKAMYLAIGAAVTGATVVALLAATSGLKSDVHVVMDASRAAPAPHVEPIHLANR